MGESVDGRLARAQAVLVRAGVGARVTSAGGENEILVVHAPPSARETLARLAPEVRALGFRYVTIELEVGDP